MPATTIAKPALGPLGVGVLGVGVGPPGGGVGVGPIGGGVGVGSAELGGALNRPGDCEPGSGEKKNGVGVGGAVTIGVGVSWTKSASDGPAEVSATKAGIGRRRLRRGGQIYGGTAADEQESGEQCDP